MYSEFVIKFISVRNNIINVNTHNINNIDKNIEIYCSIFLTYLVVRYLKSETKRHDNIQFSKQLI